MNITVRALLAVSLLAIAGLTNTASAGGATPPPCAACKTYGAPGPIAGAGLPVLAVGYGVYWLIRRRRKTQ